VKKCTKCHKIKDESEYWTRGYRKGSKKKRLYSYCNICAREAQRLFRINNPDKWNRYEENRKNSRSQESLEQKSKYHKKYIKNKIDSLDDWYIKMSLTINSPLKSEDITQEMIEAKRVSIQLKRALGLTNYKKGDK